MHFVNLFLCKDNITICNKLKLVCKHLLQAYLKIHRFTVYKGQKYFEKHG